MTLLLQYADSDPETLVVRADALQDIVQQLQQIGVRFERWTAARALAADAAADEVLSAYADDVARLQQQRGYKSADVVRLKRDAQDPSWPAKAQVARTKFLDEHTHSEDEVRFFVEGSGMFCLHVHDRVYLLVCERGDLLSVPAGTRHWFDMGSDPAFCAIRLFGTEAGWGAQFTGDKLASSFLSFDQVKQRYI